MVKLLMLDLGETLESGDQVLPHVPQALETLAGFITEQGEVVERCLVSDFHLANDQNEISSLFEDYVQILEALNLKSFFEPVNKHITLSTHAGVFKPAKIVFETAITRLGKSYALDECLFITENQSHLEQCKTFGMKTLWFDKDGDFQDWREGPLVIAKTIGPGITQNFELALNHFLQSEGFENIAILPTSRSISDIDNVNARLSVWHPLSIPELADLDGVEVMLPAQASIQLNPKGNVENINLSKISPEAEEEATFFVKSLAEKNAIQTAEQKLRSGMTHSLITDNQGHKKLIRKRFSKH